MDELRQGAAQGVDVPTLDRLAWVNVAAPEMLSLERVSSDLGRGERQVIATALGRPDSLVILDDSKARDHAKTLGLRFTGTLGILVKGKQAGDISTVRPLLDRLEAVGFFLDPAVRDHVLRLAGENL